PAADAVLTIAPPVPCLSIWRISYFMHSHTPLRSTAMTRSKFSSVSSAVLSWRPAIPALLCAQSSRPKCLTAAATVASTSAARVTSHLWNAASPPALLIRATVSSPAGTASTTSTLAPSRAAAKAEARPIPLAAPVTKATLPCNSPAIVNPPKMWMTGPRAPRSARGDHDVFLRHEKSHLGGVDEFCAVGEQRLARGSGEGRRELLGIPEPELGDTVEARLRVQVRLVDEMRLDVAAETRQLERERSMHADPVLAEVLQCHAGLALELPDPLDKAGPGRTVIDHVVLRRHPLDSREVDEVALVGERAVEILRAAAQSRNRVERLDQHFGFAVVGRVGVGRGDAMALDVA